MAVTLLQVVQRVRRNVGLDPTITTFSENDESNDNVQDINEAYEELIQKLSSSCPYLHNSATITTADGTRLYALASDSHPFDLNEWDFENETESDASIDFATREYVESLDHAFDETEGKPRYVYLEGSDQVGFYPVPDGTYTVKYTYGKHPTSRLSATSATFILPDTWVRFIEKRAQEKYERRKAFESAETTAAEALYFLSEILVEAWEMEPTYLL